MEETFLQELNQKQNEALNDVNQALQGISYEDQSLNLDSVNFDNSFEISQHSVKQQQQPVIHESFTNQNNSSQSYHTPGDQGLSQDSFQLPPTKSFQEAVNVQVEPDSTLNMEKYLKKVNDDLQNELDQANDHMQDVSQVKVKERDSLDDEFDKLFNRPVLLPEVSVIEETPQKKPRKKIPLPDDSSHLFKKDSSVRLSSPHSLGPYVDVELETSLFGNHGKLPEVDECDFDKSHGDIRLPEPSPQRTDFVVVKKVADEFEVLKERIEHLEHDKSQLRHQVEQLNSRKQTPVPLRQQDTSFEQENSFDMESINRQNNIVTLKSKISLLERRLEHSEFTAKKYQDERDLALHDAEQLKREVQRLQLQVTDLRRQVSTSSDTKDKLKQDVKSKLLSRSVGVVTQKTSSPVKQSPLRSTVTAVKQSPLRAAKPHVTRKQPVQTHKTWAQLKSHDPLTCDLCRAGGSSHQFRHYDHALDVTREDIGNLIQLLEDERYALNQKYEAVLDQYKNKKYQNEDSIVTEMNSLLETMTTKAEELSMLKKTQQAHGLSVPTPKSNLLSIKEQQRLSKLKKPHVCTGHCK